MFYVYEHWRPDTDKCFYVGKGKGQRAYQLSRRNPHHSNVISKVKRLGLDVDVRIVSADMAEQDAHALEVERIKFWRLEGAPLVNITDGGEGVTGLRHSEETRAKIKEAIKEGLPERSRAHSLRMKGRNLTEEHKKAISEGNRGKVFSPETIEKIREKNIGRKPTDQARENMRRAQLGKKHSPEQNARRIASRKASGGQDRQAAAMCLKWQDPEFRAKMSAILSAAQFKRQARLRERASK